jgi:putative spermidine/putrescine transport system substrate-binding protein
MSLQERITLGEEITRRDFLRIGGTGLAGATLLNVTGCGIFGQQQGASQGDSGEGRVVFTDSGGSLWEAHKKAYINSFQEDTDIRVVHDAPVDPAKMEAMVENNQVTWDVVTLASFLNHKDQAKWFEPLDYSVIDTAGIEQSLRSKYRISYMIYALGIGYRTDDVDQKPQSWQDFYDLKRFPGKRGISSTVFGLPLETALLADGVSPSDLYPLDVDRALAKLDTIKDSLVYWGTGEEIQQQLADGEVVMSAALNGRVQSAIDGGAPLDFVWNQWLRLTDVLVVPKGSPNKDAAMELIAYIVAGQNNGKLANYIPYAPVNDNSIDRIPEDRAKLLPTYGNRPEQAVDQNLDWYDDSAAEAEKRYQEWQLG